MPYTSPDQLASMRANIQAPSTPVTLKPSGSIFGAPPTTTAPKPTQPNTGQPANQADFLGEGTFGTQQAPLMRAPVRVAAPNPVPVSGYNYAPKTVSGGAIYDPAAQQRAFDAGNIGGAGGAANTSVRTAAPSAPGAPASTSPLNYYMEGQLKGMANPQIAASQSLGQFVQGSGQAALGQQQQMASGFNQRGLGFDATAARAAPTLGIGEQVSLAGGTRAPAALSTSQLGATPTIGQIGQVAGQLGAAPQAAGVSSIAGRLGAAPSVGQVGNIQNAAGPGGITGQLGQQGATNADQAGMLGRLNSFLDAGNGPSMAEAQLQQAQAGNMADLIGAARSGRGGAGAQAQALRGAMSEGSAIMSDTAGQLATLRAQEEDMLKNRQLNAIGLGGDMATAQRGQDLSFRGQNLQGLQGDQATALGARGQDIQTAMANQGTQTTLEQLRAQTALGARGQNLSALQGDQGTAAQMSLGQLQANLGARGQDLSALQGDQSTALGREGLAAQTALSGRGQDLSLLQGNQATALGARGQDVQRELGLQNVNLGMRGQDASVLTADADRNLAAQQLELNAGLGYGGLANDARGQGLQYLSQANQQGVMSQGLANDMSSNLMNNYTSMSNAQTAADAGLAIQNAQNAGQPSFGESLAIAGMQSAPALAGPLMAAFSDERAKTDISLDSIKASLDEHLRAAPGYGYRYRPGFGEDTETERAGPMAQDLEKSPFGRDIVKSGPGGYKVVDTSRLALVNHAALSSMRSELDNLKAQLEEDPAPPRWKRTARAKQRIELEA
jgi:hypothetical protein